MKTKGTLTIKQGDFLRRSEIDVVYNGEQGYLNLEKPNIDGDDLHWLDHDEVEELIEGQQSVADLLDQAKAICNKFVEKVRTGRARSVETYSDCEQFLEALKIFRGRDV